MLPGVGYDLTSKPLSGGWSVTGGGLGFLDDFSEEACHPLAPSSRSLPSTDLGRILVGWVVLKVLLWNEYGLIPAGLSIDHRL